MIYSLVNYFSSGKAALCIRMDLDYHILFFNKNGQIIQAMGNITVLKEEENIDLSWIEDVNEETP